MKQTKRSIYLPPMYLALGLLLSPYGTAESTSAADMYWVADKSNTYICQGYYQPPLKKKGKDSRLRAEADNTAYDGQDQIVLVGNASLFRKNFKLKADRISFSNSTGDGDAEGNVVIHRPDAVFLGKEASINIKTNAFELTDLSFVMHKNRLRGESKRAIGTPNANIQVIDGKITFCAPETNAWDLEAKRISLNQTSGRGWANNVIFRVKEIPIFFTPVLGFPIDDRRLTGFLLPSFEFGSKSGTEIVTPFYWNLSPNYDVLIRPRVITGRGNAIGLNARYLFEDLSLFELKTEHLPDDKITKTDRYISNVTIKSDPSQSVIWNLTYEDMSDETYQTDLNNFASLPEKKQITSSLGANVRGENWTVGWLFDHVDTVDPSVTAANTKFSKQPQLLTTWSDYGDIANLFATGDVTKFYRDIAGDSDISEGLRLSSNLKASFPFYAPFGSLTLSQLGFLRRAEAKTGSTTQETSYLVYGASIDGKLNFERHTSKGSTHSLTPRAKLLVREPDKNPTILTFDSADTENTKDTVRQLFLDNPSSGGDFVGDTRQLTFSLTSSGLDANAFENYRIELGRTIFLQDRGITLSGINETAEQGPLVFESKVSLTSSLKWNTRIATESDSEFIKTASNEIKYKKSNTDYVTQRTVWDNESATRSDFFYSNQISNRWRMLAGLQWAPNTDTRINQIAGLEYESCCWRVAIVHAYERDERTTSDGGHSTKLQVELKGLGTIGQGALSLMDRLLEGYELADSRY